MTIIEFKKLHLGNQVEYHSYGGGAYNQCVDLVNAYINQVLDNNTKDYTEIIGTNAKDFNTKYDKEDFEWIDNSPTGIPQAGDIIVWSGKVGGGAGHVAIVLEANVNTFKSLDQNWSQVERVTEETHNYNNVLGWLRPKNFAGENTIPVDKKVFEELVGKATQRDEFVNAGYDSPQKVKDIIEGHQSRITKAENERDTAQSDLRVAKEKQKIAEEAVATKEKECQTREQLLLSQIDELKKTHPDTEEMIKTYESQLKVERESKDKALGDLAKVRIENAKLKDTSKMTFFDRIKYVFNL